MLTLLGRSIGLVLLVATLVPAAPFDRASHSAAIATQLAKALSEQRLDTAMCILTCPGHRLPIPASFSRI